MERDLGRCVQLQVRVISLEEGSYVECPRGEVVQDQAIPSPPAFGDPTGEKRRHLLATVWVLETKGK